MYGVCLGLGVGFEVVLGRCVCVVIEEYVFMGFIIFVLISSFINEDSFLFFGDFIEFFIKFLFLGVGLVFVLWGDWREVDGVFCWCK